MGADKTALSFQGFYIIIKNNIVNFAFEKIEEEI